MPPLSLATFARRFDRLGADDRLEFVAALWSARGWETRRDDDCVVARDGDGDVERRIRVYSPGLFGGPTFDGVDVLVVTDADESVAAAAADHGVRYVDPADLRDRLLYGIPREDAAHIADAHLGRSLTTARSGSRPGSRSTGLRRRGTELRRRLPDSNRLVVLVVLLSVVGVVVAGPALIPTGNTSASVPEGDVNYTPGTVGAIGSTGTDPGTSDDASAMPPGLSRGEVSDLPRLASATAAIMEEKGWALQAYREGPDRSIWRIAGDRWMQTVRAANDTNYRSVLEVEDDNVTTTSDTYSDGETVYFRTTNMERDPGYRTRPVDDGTDVQRVQSKVRTAIVAYLSTDDTRVRCAGTLENSNDCFAYRIVADGTPDLLSDVVRNYSARATVSDTGLVTSLDVRYTVPDPEDRSEREQVRFGFTFHGHGNVTVLPPAWLSEATERTEDGGSATPTATPEIENATTAEPTTTESG